MPIEKGKSKTYNRKMRIDRNLRLWLANRRIFIFRRKNKVPPRPNIFSNRRQRVRSKPLKKRGEVARTALDLPTTDPGSDLHFSTDDEELSPTGKERFGVVAPLRHTLLQSELQRRYIEEIGDMVVQKPKAVHHHMPPELIVTTPSNITGPGGVKTFEIYKLTPRTAPEQQEGVSQLKASPTIPTAARRTYSWHNLNHENSHARPNFFVRDPKPSVKIYRTPPRRNVPNNFIPLAQQRNNGNADDLQLKLSLKKKIWTGAHGEPDTRPLAWYKGHQCKTHTQLANVMASAAATAMRVTAGGQTQNMFSTSSKELVTSVAGTVITPAIIPPAYVGAPRRPRKVDQVDLFNACSQKLLMWQQEHKKLQPMHSRLMGGTTSVKLEDSHVQMRSKPKKGIKTASDSEVVPNTGKGKRKSSIIKISESTQLVTRFSRTRNNTGSSANNTTTQKQQITQMQRLIFKDTEQINNAAAVDLQQQSTVGRSTNKFKTGGIVVTAVQQSLVKNAGSAAGVSRRMRHAGLLHIKNGRNTVVNDDNATQYRRNSSSVQINKPITPSGISLDTVSLVRKVKTKLKKRKSRTLSKAAPAAVK
ncbi:hypothetical protein KR093_008774 [Drosophila rubida]|uniref:Uncharacterized protein n=1 Tax=Drosophila rubida TaxID=30044 RepID=A0AAD4PP80_9MUSC|nr:hypothetical protein KR093_008774 [Drosophila rubida]